MEIREAYRDEIGALAEAREILGPAFPSSESLLKLRQSPHVLMPVAAVGPEIVGFAIAKVITVRRGRFGTVLYLASLVGEGPVDLAIKGALPVPARTETQGFRSRRDPTPGRSAIRIH